MDIEALPSTTDDLIFDPLSPAELYKYARTCKAAHHTVHSYIRRKFRLHKLLSRYFSDPEIYEFRLLQFNTGMVISGSTALQFFDRAVYEDSDLDLYVEHRYRKPIAVWLMQIGYQYTPHSTSEFRTLNGALSSSDPGSFRTGVNLATFGGHPDYYNAILVLTFEKQRPYRKVQVITSMFSPISKVLRFHSTCVMNIITHNKAYSFFPRATFEGDRRSLKIISVSTQHSSTEKALEKYASRGWTVIGAITRDDFDGPNAAFPTGLRRVGDAKCWTMPVLPDIDLPEGYVENNAWVGRYDQDMRMSVWFHGMYSRTQLRFGYIFPADPDLWDWIKEITRRSYAENSPKLDIRYDDAYASLIKWYFDVYC